VGRGAGVGYTVNVPLSAGADNAVYVAAFNRVVLPVIEQFGPDLTLVSAGYDAHRRDPLGGMQLDGAGYAWMTRRLLETVQRGPDSRIGFLLEGGYDLAGLRESISHTLGALGAAPPDQVLGPLSSRHEAEIERAADQQRAFWRV
jgi:acetoin utilization deacetylase AcuC-like enzyme